MKNFDDTCIEMLSHSGQIEEIMKKADNRPAINIENLANLEELEEN